jgi:DNA-binding SARP family transcriptional activator
VYRPDDTPVAWNVARGAPTKVKTLFAFLLAKGMSGATQEQLVDLLWPEQTDFEKGLSRLHHTVHCLRRALEPELGGDGKGSRYILREGERYFLRLPRNAWIDVAAFEELCYQGEYLTRLGREEDALACYLAAERLYAGDYLADIPLEYVERLDDDWCWSRRFWLQEMHIKLFLCLAELYLKRGAYREALAYYRKALTQDPTREEAHQGMMRVFREAGRRDALARQHQLWQEFLHRLDGDLFDPETAER